MAGDGGRICRLVEFEFRQLGAAIWWLLGRVVVAPGGRYGERVEGGAWESERSAAKLE